MDFRRLIALLALVGSWAWPSFSFATMASTNYKIEWDTLSAGGSNTSVSASSTYLLRDTIGGTAVGESASTSYQNTSGFRGGTNDQVITFDLFAQATAGNAAAQSLVGTVVSVPGTEDLSSFAVGDFAAVIQDLGASQVASMGKITAKTASSLTFDTLTNGGSAPTIDGTNDYVVRLSGTGVAFGALSSTTVSTKIIGFNVTADVDNGYTIQAASNGAFTTGANDITGVSDGSVTAGAPEYGGRSSDTSVAGSTFDSADTAFTTSFQPIVSNTGNLFEDRSFLTLKVAVSSGMATGTYNQTLSLVISGNY